MAKHIYMPNDIGQLKQAVIHLRDVQKRIDDDNEAYQAIDAAMSGIEMIIDDAEGEAE